MTVDNYQPSFRLGPVSSFLQSLTSSPKKGHQVCPVFQAHHQTLEFRMMAFCPVTWFLSLSPEFWNHLPNPVLEHFAPITKSFPMQVRYTPLQPLEHRMYVLHFHNTLCMPLITIELPSSSVDSMLLTVVSLIFRLDLTPQGGLNNIPQTRE